MKEISSNRNLFEEKLQALQNITDLIGNHEEKLQALQNITVLIGNHEEKLQALQNITDLIGNRKNLTNPDFTINITRKYAV